MQVRDNVPDSFIATKTGTLEVPRTWATGIEMSRLLSEVYNIEFAERVLVDRMSTEVQARITSLYAYSRFDNETLSGSTDVADATIEVYPSGAVNTAKYKAERAWTRICNRVSMFVYRRFKKEISLPKYPARARASISTREIVTRQNREIHIERVQESLLAQIALLYKYDIEPQAILAHPSIALSLYAVRVPPEQTSIFSSAGVHRGGFNFAGLPVVSCMEIERGAMVV